MPRSGIILLLLSSLAWSQAATPPSAPKPQLQTREEAPAKTDAAANVPPDAPVITINGMCEGQPVDKPAPAECKTVVTRQQFDAVAAAVAPNAPAAGRKQLASRYAAVLVMSMVAHQQGLDQGSRYDEMVKLARMQASAQELQRSWQEKASQISDKDVEDYYHSNSANYEEVTLQRIFVPRSKQSDVSSKAAKTGTGAKAPEDNAVAMKKEAEELRKRAAAGEDLAKLQREGNEAAGLKAQTPDVADTKVRRNSLPPSQAAIFDLKAGEVSQVMDEPTGFSFYKIKSKDAVPLESVREEVRKTLSQQRLQDSAKSLQKLGEPKLDEAYFGPNQPGPMAPSLAHPPSGKPVPEPD